MAINFPLNPAVGTIHPPSGAGARWRWDGTKWLKYTGSVSGGDTGSTNVIINTDPATGGTPASDIGPGDTIVWQGEPGTPNAGWVAIPFAQAAARADSDINIDSSWTLSVRDSDNRSHLVLRRHTRDSEIDDERIVEVSSVSGYDLTDSDRVIEIIPKSTDFRRVQQRLDSDELVLEQILRVIDINDSDNIIRSLVDREDSETVSLLLGLIDSEGSWRTSIANSYLQSRRDDSDAGVYWTNTLTIERDSDLGLRKMKLYRRYGGVYPNFIYHMAEARHDTNTDTFNIRDDDAAVTLQAFGGAYAGYDSETTAQEFINTIETTSFFNTGTSAFQTGIAQYYELSVDPSGPRRIRFTATRPGNFRPFAQQNVAGVGANHPGEWFSFDGVPYNTSTTISNYGSLESSRGDDLIGVFDVHDSDLHARVAADSDRLTSVHDDLLDADSDLRDRIEVLEARVDADSDRLTALTDGLDSDIDDAIVKRLMDDSDLGQRIDEAVEALLDGDSDLNVLITEVVEARLDADSDLLENRYDELSRSDSDIKVRQDLDSDRVTRVDSDIAVKRLVDLRDDSAEHTDDFLLDFAPATKTLTIGPRLTYDEFDITITSNVNTYDRTDVTPVVFTGSYTSTWTIDSEVLTGNGTMNVDSDENNRITITPADEQASVTASFRVQAQITVSEDTPFERTFTADRTETLRVDGYYPYFIGRLSSTPTDVSELTRVDANVPNSVNITGSNNLNAYIALQEDVNNQWRFKGFDIIEVEVATGVTVGDSTYTIYRVGDAVVGSDYIITR